MREVIASGVALEAAVNCVEQERETFAAEQDGAEKRALLWVLNAVDAHPLGAAEVELGLIQATRRLDATELRALLKELEHAWPTPDACRRRILARTTALAEIHAWADSGGIKLVERSLLLWLLELQRPRLVERRVIPAEMLAIRLPRARSIATELQSIAPVYASISGNELERFVQLLKAPA